MGSLDLDPHRGERGKPRVSGRYFVSPGEPRGHEILDHDPALRRCAKAVASTENTSSPRWLVPVWRASRMPHCGRFSETRLEAISLAKLMVSPASTGLIQRNSRNPGEGPSGATSSPRASAAS